MTANDASGEGQLRFTAGIGNDARPEEVAACAAVLDEETVFEAFLVGDERLEYNTYSALALAAAETERIDLGTGVTNPYTRHPAVTAAAAATLDTVSDGRARVGLGAGSPIVLDPLGYDQDDPVGTLRDGVRTVRSLLAGETVSVDRPEFTAVDADLDVLPPSDVPIYVAGRGPAVLGLGGYRGDGVIAGAGLASPAGVDYAEEHVARGARKADRDPDAVDLVVWAFLSMAADGDVARAGVVELVARIVAKTPMGALEAIGLDPADAQTVKDADADADGGVADLATADLLDLVPRPVLEQFAVVGTPAECRERVERLREAGADHLGLLAFENDARSRRESLRAFDDAVARPLRESERKRE